MNDLLRVGGVNGPHAGACLGGSRLGAGGLPLGEAEDAPGEDLCGRMGVVQGALACDVLQKTLRVMAGCLGIGEDGGECGPGTIFEDLFRVVGHGGSDLPGVPFDGGRRGLAPGEGSQR